MSTESPQATLALEDYLELLDSLAGLGVEFVVIGGCAVGAYARLIGETVFSNDLDLFVTQRALETVVSDCSAIDARLEKVSAPRAIPVAVLEWRGREINLLTASDGFPPPDVEARSAREFHVGSPSVAVPIADPFDLLRNKLAVNRPKDGPHIAILRRFLDEEAVQGFVQEEEPRARIVAAERLLEVLATKTLDEGLAGRLVPVARTAADFRFLAHRIPTRTLIPELLERAPRGLVQTLERILRSRGLFA